MYVYVYGLLIKLYHVFVYIHVYNNLYLLVITFCYLASQKIFEHKLFSVWLAKCTRKCIIRLTITFQGYRLYYYLVARSVQAKC